jgi:hypothetical protein
MNLPSFGKSDSYTMGNFAGWSITFFKVDGHKLGDEIFTLDSDHYNAELSARLTSGLDGGSYTFVFEGLSDEDYGKLATGKIAAHLFMGWRDTGGLGNYIASSLGIHSMPKGGGKESAGFVAELKVTQLSRRVGARYYETVIEAREWVYDYLAEAKVTAEIIKKLGNDPLSAYEVVSKIAGDLAKMHPSPELEKVKDVERGNVAKDRTLLSMLESLGQLMDKASPYGGRGLYLIRDGVLHVGYRPIPLTGSGKEKELVPSNGLVDAQNTRRQQVDDKKTIYWFRLTLKGRSEIKPGDVVKFDPPKEEQITQPGLGGIFRDLVSPLTAGLSGGLSDNSAQLYVEAVEHRMGRTLGFVTTVDGVVISGTKNKEAWDEKEIGEGSAQQADGGNDGRAARSINERIRSSKVKLALTDVGQIRHVETKADAKSPAQTVDVWRGLAPDDGIGNGARRLAIARPSPAPATGAAYMTLFAWGKTGLVLPYYPGTRALVAHRKGELDDPVVLGALWENPPASEAGDWWLSLPVGVPENTRQTLADDETAKPANDLKATHDLIDADGNRVIEVGEFVLRVGRNSLKKAGTRPHRPEKADSITIEHADGECKIILDKNGTVTIKAKNIKIEADDNVDVKAKKVNFKVSDSVNVD